MSTFLVTGANKGIGLACCEAILEQSENNRVLLGSRDKARGEAAKAQLASCPFSRVCLF